jgi:hypothetical protein
MLSIDVHVEDGLAESRSVRLSAFQREQFILLFFFDLRTSRKKNRYSSSGPQSQIDTGGALYKNWFELAPRILYAVNADAISDFIVFAQT